jgi:CRP/FNR family transcriptional regulator
MSSDTTTPVNLPLTMHLSASQRREVLDAGHDTTVRKGEVLFHEQEDAAAMYAVVTGRIKLVRYSPAGREMLLHLVRPGETFAEAALFGSGTYPATAIAVEDSRLWCLPRHRLEELVRRSPELGLALVGSVSLWTRKLAAKLELLTQRRVEERLAVYVVGRGGDGDLRPGASITLTEPKHLIAAQCGTAPEVLSRTFRRLEGDGILRVDGDTVQILDVDRLRALAEWIDDAG